MLRLIFWTSLLVNTALYSNRPPSLAITESIPSAIVAGAVNVITGDHYFTEEDIVVHGAFPIKIPRTYISSFGWEQFPHLHASLATKKDGRSDCLYWFITVVEPSGTRLEFQREAKELRKHDPGPMVFQLNPTAQGLTNTAKGEISGKTNLKNIRLELSKDRKDLTFYAPDGTVRTYWKIDCHKTGDIKDEKDCLFILQCEQHPNQSKTVYIYDDHRRLAIVRTMNLDGTKTFASATIPNHAKKEPDYDIQTSDGRTLSFRYDYQKKDGVTHSLLSRVSTPAYTEEVLSYHRIKEWGFLLNRRLFSDNRYYGVDYYVEGKNHVGGREFKIKTTNPLWRRIKTLNAPVGVDTTPIVTHTFTYDVTARVTSVRDIDNILTQYRYSPNYRLEHILYYGPAGSLHHSERYVWGEEGPLAANLLCHTFLDHQNTPIFSKRFFYDNQGNLQEEKLYGNLSGRCTVPIVLGSDGFPQDNGVETYTIKRSYSQDRFNLLLREEEQNGKITLYQYYPNSAVVLAQFICDHNQNKIRHFYEYNNDFILAREITDDGNTADKNSLYGVKTRLIKEYSLIPDGQPYQGMPHIITEKYWDGGAQVQLKRTVLTYTIAGCVERQDIYDADDNYCYTLTAKYDAAGRVKEETNAIGQTAVHDYDRVGNKILFKEFSGKKQNKMDYDFSNRLRRIEERGSDGIVYATHHGYNMRHQRIATQDIYGNETRFISNAFGQVEQIHYPPITNPSGGFLYPKEKRGYDSGDRPIQVINGRGNEKQQKFNARNQIISIDYPDKNAESLTYHLDGTLASHTNQESATTTYTYDFLGRMLSQTNALGHTTTYRYDSFNLIFFGKRFYDPKYGRWLTPDPAGFVDGYNLYSFVANNPLTNFDDYGLFITPILSLPPAAADIEEAKQIATPVIHAAGDLAIEASRLCADTGFIISSPWTLYQNNFQWSKVEDRWDSMQRTFDHAHNHWDQKMQRSMPMSERESSYSSIRTTAIAAGEAYLLTQAAGPWLLEKGAQGFKTLATTSNQVQDFANRFLDKNIAGKTRLTRAKIRNYLSNTQSLDRQKITTDFESIGLKLKGKSPEGKFIEFRDRLNNVRVKIHPADKVTRYEHLHIYDKLGNPLNKHLKVVDKNSLDAHIPFGGAP